MTVQDAIAHTEKLCLKWGLDPESERKYLQTKAAQISAPVNGRDPVDWLNGFYLKHLASQTSQVKAFIERCRQKYREDKAELVKNNGGNPVVTFSFEHCYNDKIEGAIMQVWNQMEKFQC